jgi:hypothetical protein
MTRLIGPAWVPMVVVAVGAFSVSRLRGVFGSYVWVPAFGTADLIVQFKPEGMICEVYGPAGRVAAGALRCWSSQRGMPATGVLLIGWRKVFR